MSVAKKNSNLWLYIVIGMGAALLDYLTFFVLSGRFLQNSPEIASIIGQGVGFIFSFFINTYFNFKKTDKLLKRFAYYLFITIIGMVISTFFIQMFKFDIDIYILKFFCLTIVSLFQYSLNKAITYRN